MRQSGRVRERVAAIGSPDAAAVDGISIPFAPWRPTFFDQLRAAAHRERALLEPAMMLPVALGIGAILYLAAPEEPGLVPPIVVLVGLSVASFVVRSRYQLFAILLFLALVVGGFVLGKLRTLTVATPVVERSVTGTVIGIVHEVEARPKHRMRIVVRPIAIEGLKPPHLPGLIRVSAAGRLPEAGDSVSFRAILRPPPAAPVPGGYDFARDAFFDGIGAVGFVLGRLRKADSIEPGIIEQGSFALDRARNHLTTRIVTVIGGDAGAVAASLVTGKRGLIEADTNKALRSAGLYHVISISGLHMAIFAGGIFGLIRSGLALSPTVAIRHSTKRIAALVALLLAALYVVFAGLEVATFRSFLMTAMVLAGVALQRRAITRRNLFLAAGLVLALTPEAVLGPGFQMSFSAVALLVAASDRHWHRADGPPTWLGRALRLVAGLCAVTLIATLATAPFAAFHFHRLTAQALAANLVATPIVSGLIMPLSFAAVLLEPFGYATPVWRLVGWAVELFLAVADRIADWPGADLFTRQFPATALGCFAVAILLLALLRTRLAVAAVLPAGLGLLLVIAAPVPVALVGAGGYAALVRNGDDLALIAQKRDAFLAHEWLLSMGDGRDPDDPSLVATTRCDLEGCSAEFGSGRVLMLDRTLNAVEEDCGRVTILVTPKVAPTRCRKTSLVIDRTTLRDAATIAVYDLEGAFRMEASRPPGMNRPWGRRPFAEPMIEDTEISDIEKPAPVARSGFDISSEELSPERR